MALQEAGILDAVPGRLWTGTNPERVPRRFYTWIVHRTVWKAWKPPIRGMGLLTRK